MASSTVKSVTASCHVLFLLLIIFFSDKSAGARSVVDKGSLTLPNADGFVCSNSGGRGVGHSSNVMPFREVRKLRGRALVPPPPKPNGNVSYNPPNYASPPTS
ncbi:hypothetical protein SUGI_0199310 [Cryptomeria japonica]|uniref:uncharacterized protein LOC131041159 n=1 Tax=Cryptomeria japonica TaxID=3369 RepID=UPI002408DE5F|nr:uncharacterized protein LOC131041159 [Cryptomeria japonica]GLJ12857.1 hypothetical protein SUGI_0199310 [Cryptomeria japonica]